MRHIVLVIRGEALREGDMGEHNVTQFLDSLRETMMPYKTHLFDHLVKDGYKVSVLADLMTDDLLLAFVNGRIETTEVLINFSQHSPRQSK